MQGKLLREIYEEANIEPSKVAYVEAHGTGTKVSSGKQETHVSLCPDNLPIRSIWAQRLPGSCVTTKISKSVL